MWEVTSESLEGFKMHHEATQFNDGKNHHHHHRHHRHHRHPVANVDRHLSVQSYGPTGHSVGLFTVHFTAGKLLT